MDPSKMEPSKLARLARQERIRVILFSALISGLIGYLLGFINGTGGKLAIQAPLIVNAAMHILPAYMLPPREPRRALVDLGANCGNSYMDFYRGWAKAALPVPITSLETFLFEPNPKFKPYIQKLIDEVHRNDPGAVIRYVPKASATSDGTASFYIDPSLPIGGWERGDGYGSGGSSLIADMPATDPDNPNNPNVRQGLVQSSSNKQKIDVETVDFSRWLMRNFNPEDEVYMKVDIEGYEIELFRKMIHDGSICIPRIIFVEWHSGFLQQATTEETRKMGGDEMINEIKEKTMEKCKRPVHWGGWF